MTKEQKADAVIYLFKSPIRAGFTNIIKARAYEENGKSMGEPRFDATFTLEPDSADLKQLQGLCVGMAKGMYPGKRLVARRLTQEELDSGDVVEISVPWKDGTKDADRAKEDGKDREWARGKILLKASSKYAPALSGVEGGKIVSYSDPNTRPTLEKLFYAGAYLVPYVQLHTYKARDQKPGGVSLWLNAVCFVKHGPRLSGGGGVNAAEVFKDYAGTVVTENPNGELDDEIPF